MKFESDGFDVRLAANGQNWHRSSRKVSARYYFARLQMPEMDGAEALKRIRSKDWEKLFPLSSSLISAKKKLRHDLKKIRNS